MILFPAKWVGYVIAVIAPCTIVRLLSFSPGWQAFCFGGEGWEGRVVRSVGTEVKRGLVSNIKALIVHTYPFTFLKKSTSTREQENSVFEKFHFGDRIRKVPFPVIVSSFIYTILE